MREKVQPWKQSSLLRHRGLTILRCAVDGTPFTFNGHSIRIKHNLRLLSPYNYKVGVTVSVDGGPFRNYGNPWWRKDPA